MNRFKHTEIASVLGIIGNLFLLVIKAIAGFMTNSQAMIADAFNSAGDIFSSLMTYIGNKISSKPKDHDHNLGHGKAEYIYSMFISIVMFVVAIYLFKDSFFVILNKETYTFSKWLVIVCIITILVKGLLFIYTDRLAKKYNNLLVKANSKDHRNDVLITTSNLISCIFAYYGIFFFDGIVGIAIASWIMVTALELYKESYNVLMDKSISEETKKRVYDIIERHEEIKKVNHFNSTPVGYRYQISFTIFVDGNLSTFDSHDIANKLEKEIDKEIKEIYLTVIHVNPIEIKDKKKKDK